MKEKQKMAEVYIRYISNKLNLKAIKAFPLKCKSRRMCKLYNGEFWKMPQNRQGGCGSNLLEFLQIIPKGDGILGTADALFSGGGPVLNFLLNLVRYCFCFYGFVVLAMSHVGVLAPRPGIKPAPPASEGEVLTTGLPGKPQELLEQASCSLYFHF